MLYNWFSMISHTARDLFLDMCSNLFFDLLLDMLLVMFWGLFSDPLDGAILQNLAIRRNGSQHFFGAGSAFPRAQAASLVDHRGVGAKEIAVPETPV